jgi:hypothetical protein
MENAGLENFIWVGNKLINLAHIVRFVVEDEGAGVIVYLSDIDPKNATLHVDGEAATALVNVLLEVRLGKANQMEQYSIESASARLSKIAFDAAEEEALRTSNPDAIGE